MIDWQTIDTVLLDMDGTLLDLHFDSYFWLEHLPVRYAEQKQKPFSEVQAWLYERLMREQGTLNWYCLDYWTAELEIDIVALKREVVDKIGFRPHVQDFLAALQAQGIRSVIVTNAHRDSLNLKLEHTDLGERVDRMISSHDFGYAKESQDFWRALQQTEPFDPERTLLVDDSLAVLRSAQTYGIKNLLSIVQPDSQSPARRIDEFAAIEHFSQIVPKK